MSNRHSSKVPKWHKLEISERLNILKEFCNLSSTEYYQLRNLSTLKKYKLDRIGESPISNFEYPLRIANNFKINGKDYFVPMITEEASIVAAVSYAAKLAYKTGGIKSEVVNNSRNNGLPKAKSQIQLIKLSDSYKIKEAIQRNKDEFLKVANSVSKNSTAYDIVCQNYSSDWKYWEKDMVIVDIHVDPGDSMGAAVATRMGEAVAPEIVKYVKNFGISSQCEYNLIAPSNLSGRLVHSELKVKTKDLKRKYGDKIWLGEEVKYKILWANEMAKYDKDRAITNNKGIMNGVIAVANATCQDTRAIERSNSELEYRKSLSNWRADKDYLYGKLDMLIPCGIVGGEIKNYPKAELIIKKLLGVKSADQLAEIMGAVGLTQNLAALSMVTTIGISKGHQDHRLN